jgi:hypothetical protein
MTPAFAKQQKTAGYFNQFRGRPIDRNYQYVKDPAWDDEEELYRRFPLGSLMHPVVVKRLAAEDAIAREQDRLNKIREANRTWTKPLSDHDATTKEPRHESSQEATLPYEQPKELGASGGGEKKVKVKVEGMEWEELRVVSLQRACAIDQC